MNIQTLESVRSNSNSSEPSALVFFDPGTLPWLPWVMEGTWFKLLNIDPSSGGFTMLLKVSGDNVAPVHRHIGSIEGFVLEGGMGYGDDRGRLGWYLSEPGGIQHQPSSDQDGLIMFAILRGPIAGLQDNGTVSGLVDAKLMYEMAAAGRAADHIEKPAAW